MSIVRFRAAKLIVRLARPKRPVWKILQLATATLVTEKNIKLAIRSEPEHATVVVTALRLTGILLNCAEPDDVFV
jgi:hypothetical protein